MSQVRPVIRPERVDDAAAVGALLQRCFPGEPVDRLVEALRAGSGYLPELALVAQDDALPGGVAGFVMATTTAFLEPDLDETNPLSENGLTPQIPLLCLSPLAVHPDAQGRGVARALVEAVLAVARAGRPEPLLVLEGEPALYARFGFVAASSRGLRAPSERIPAAAFQAVPLAGASPSGRVRYDEVFWTVVTPGLPFEGITWLDELERQCRAIDTALTAAGGFGPATPVPACPGWTVADVLDHLAAIHRLVLGWLDAGRRPRVLPPVPGATPAARFALGWRALHAGLSAVPADAPTATWSPWDDTARFWRRRMVHEHAIHAADLAEALGTPWSVPDDVALDGIDEALRLWLGTRLGSDVRGGGDAVRLVAGDVAAPRASRTWSVVLHQRFAEVHDLPVAAEAELSAAPSELYRWVWGRSAEVRATGSTVAVQTLQSALRRATG